MLSQPLNLHTCELNNEKTVDSATWNRQILCTKIYFPCTFADRKIWDVEADFFLSFYLSTKNICKHTVERGSYHLIYCSQPYGLTPAVLFPIEGEQKSW